MSNSWYELALEQLEQTYAKIPGIACKGLCADFCGPIDMGPVERYRIRKTGVRITSRQEALKKLQETGGEWTCDALSEAGRCTVHADRPGICRIWGVAESMRCPYGCTPERVMPDAEAYAILSEARTIGLNEHAVSEEGFQRALKTPEGSATQRALVRPYRDRKRSRRLRGESPGGH